MIKETKDDYFKERDPSGQRDFSSSNLSIQAPVGTPELNQWLRGPNSGETNQLFY